MLSRLRDLGDSGRPPGQGSGVHKQNVDGYDDQLFRPMSKSCCKMRSPLCITFPPLTNWGDIGLLRQLTAAEQQGKRVAAGVVPADLDDLNAVVRD